MLSLETKITLLNLLPYFFVSFIVLCISIIFYIRVKFGFWYYQPVFHVYDILYFFWNPGIIIHTLPNPNKFCNFKNINTYPFSQLSEIKKNEIVHFIQTNYFREKNNYFHPKRENFDSYFIGFSDPCFLSLFTENILMFDKKNNVARNTTKISGVISSRPIHIFLSNESVKAIYVDYLCVDLSQRKKGIGPQLIQTHHYDSSHQKKEVIVALFKKEHELTGIVPLCLYNTFGFKVTKWRKPYPLPGSYQILDASVQNFHVFLDFIKAQKKNFDVCIWPDEGNFIELLKTENIYISGILENQQLQSIYFFRKTRIFIHDDLHILSCFASCQNKEFDSNVFIHGFKCSFWNIANKHKFGYCTIEDISHNYKIIQNLREKTYPDFESPTAYFLYNFIMNPLPSQKCLILV